MILFKKFVLSFKQLLLISFIIISAIPLLILGIFAYTQAEHNYYSEKEQIIENNLDQVQNNLNFKVDSVNNALMLLVYNTGLADLFAAQEKGVFENYIAFRDILDPSLNNIYSMNPEVKKISFYTDSPLANIRSDIKDLNSADVAEKLKDFKPSINASWHLDGNKIYVISELASISKKNYQTIVTLELDSQSFFSPIIFKNDEYEVTITNSKGKIYPNTGSTISKNTFTEDSPLTRDIESTNWVLNYYISRNQPNEIGNQFFYGVFGLIGLTILLAVILTHFFTRHILNVLSTLKDKVKRVTDNDLEVDFRTSYTDEFGELSNLIGDMVDSIKKLIEEVYATKIDKQDSEYQALVSQINSHFLYNSLSLINWKAIMIDNEEISYIAQTLSKFYRTSLNHGKTPIPLKEELENAKSYIELQLFLQPDSFSVDYNLLADLNDYYVINLLLQPIIENAIEHGFKSNPKDAKIEITTNKDFEGNLIIAVKDNGDGVSETDLDAILHDDHSGYGLKNINKRLQFYFGVSYGLTLHSILGEGTTVIMKLPLVHKARVIDKNDSDIL